MLNAFALPAARVPAKIVAQVSPKPGNPLAAKTMAGKVDTSNNSTTLNFIRSRYPRIVALTGKDYSAFQAVALRALTGLLVTFISTKGLLTFLSVKASDVSNKNRQDWFGVVENNQPVASSLNKRCVSVAAIVAIALVTGGLAQANSDASSTLERPTTVAAISSADATEVESDDD